MKTWKAMYQPYATSTKSRSLNCNFSKLYGDQNESIFTKSLDNVFGTVTSFTQVLGFGRREDIPQP